MRDSLVYIDDIIEAAVRILEYTRGLSFEQFKNNQMVIDAVNRNLEIIGEVSRHVADDLQSQFPCR